MLPLNLAAAAAPGSTQHQLPLGYTQQTHGGVGNTAATHVASYNSFVPHSLTTVSPYTRMPSAQPGLSHVPLAQMNSGWRQFSSTVPHTAAMPPPRRPGSASTVWNSNLSAMEPISRFHQPSVLTQMEISYTSDAGADSYATMVSPFSSGLSAGRRSPVIPPSAHPSAAQSSGGIMRPCTNDPMFSTRPSPVQSQLMNTQLFQHGRFDQHSHSNATLASDSSIQGPRSRPPFASLKQPARLDPRSQLQGQQNRPPVSLGQALGREPPSTTAPLMVTSLPANSHQRTTGTSQVQISNPPIVPSQGVGVLANINATTTLSTTPRPYHQDTCVEHAIAFGRHLELITSGKFKAADALASTALHPTSTLGKRPRDNSTAAAINADARAPKRTSTAPPVVLAQRHGPPNSNQRLSQEAAKHGAGTMAISSPYTSGTLNTLDPTDTPSKSQGELSDEQAKAIQNIRKQAITPSSTGTPPRPQQASSSNPNPMPNSHVKNNDNDNSIAPSNPAPRHTTAITRKRFLDDTGLTWPLEPTPLRRATKRQKVSPTPLPASHVRAHRIGVRMMQVENGTHNKKEVDAYASYPHRYAHLPTYTETEPTPRTTSFQAQVQAQASTGAVAAAASPVRNFLTSLPQVDMRKIRARVRTPGYEYKCSERIRQHQMSNSSSAPLWDGLGTCVVADDGVMRAPEGEWSEERVTVEIALRDLEEKKGRYESGLGLQGGVVVLGG